MIWFLMRGLVPRRRRHYRRSCSPAGTPIPASIGDKRAAIGLPLFLAALMGAYALHASQGVALIAAAVAVVVIIAVGERLWKIRNTRKIDRMLVQLLADTPPPPERPQSHWSDRR